MTNKEKIDLIRNQGKESNKMTLSILNEHGDVVDMRGPAGPKPVLGVDYFTEKDKSKMVDVILNEVTPAIEDCISEYIPVLGVDYFTDKDKKKIIKDVVSLVPKPKPGKDGKPADEEKIVSRVTSNLEKMIPKAPEIDLDKIAEYIESKREPVDYEKFATVEQLTKFLKMGGFRGGGSTATTPGGSDTQVQFNDGGSFGGNSKFTFNKTTGAVTIKGSSSAQIPLSIYSGSEAFPRIYTSGFGEIYFGGIGSATAPIKIGKNVASFTYATYENIAGDASVWGITNDTVNNASGNAESTMTLQIKTSGSTKRLNDYYANNYVANGDVASGFLMQKLNGGAYTDYQWSYYDQAGTAPSEQIRNREVGYTITPDMATGSANGTTITGTVSVSAGTTVTGVGTLFTTELYVGAAILISGQSRVVSAIASNTSLTVGAAFTISVSGVAIKVYDRIRGRFGWRLRAPSALFHLGNDVNDGSAGSAPLKINAGVVLTAPESGAIENTGTHFYWTSSAGTRYQLDQQGGQGMITELGSGVVTGSPFTTYNYSGYFDVYDDGNMNGTGIIDVSSTVSTNLNLAASSVQTINGLTGTAQLLAVGTSGTDFAISSSGATNTFNLPSASATARGVITTGTQTIAGQKTFSTGITGSYLTASQMLGTDGSKNIVSLDTATYPSLTELSYVKGVTSAIQTQLNAKQASGTYVTSVSGTTNRITSSGGTTPVIDISASYVGQASITTLGIITTGTWNAGVLGPAYGGTGVANNAAQTVTGVGNFSFTRTLTANTNVTFPTSGTLATIVKTGLAKSNGGTLQYGIPGVGLYGQGVSTLTVNSVRYIPFVVSYPITITSYQFEVTTGPAGAANVRTGIYLADTDLQPTGAALMDSTTTVALAFTGLKATTVSVALNPGIYLVCMNCDVTMSIRIVNGLSTFVNNVMGTTALIQRYDATQTYGAFPNPGTKWTTLNASTGGSQNPIVFQWTE